MLLDLSPELKDVMTKWKAMLPLYGTILVGDEREGKLFRVEVWLSDMTIPFIKSS